MPGPRDAKSLVKERVGGLLKIGRQLLKGSDRGAADATPSQEKEQRVNARIPLRIPVQACIEAGKFRRSRILDINLRGFSLEPANEAAPGQFIFVTFDGLPGVAPKFTVTGDIVRRAHGDAIGIKVDRSRSSQEALGHYRTLVLYYLRHRPLLDEVDTGYFEARCPACGWMGRVGKKRPLCSRCGDRVERLRG